MVRLLLVGHFTPRKTRMRIIFDLSRIDLHVRQIVDAVMA